MTDSMNAHDSPDPKDRPSPDDADHPAPETEDGGASDEPEGSRVTDDDPVSDALDGMDQIQRRTQRLRIHVIHGPNLNLLGEREPEIYGHSTLADVENELRAVGAEIDADIDTMQSNHEGELIDAIHEAIGAADGILINAGSLGHTSIGLRDALASAPPAVDVHVSAVHAREEFRRTSMIAPVCVATLSGFGAHGYVLALRGLAHHLRRGDD